MKIMNAPKPIPKRYLERIPFYRLPIRPKTDHAVAIAYAKQGWGEFACREDWMNNLRYKGTFQI